MMNTDLGRKLERSKVADPFARHIAMPDGVLYTGPVWRDGVETFVCYRNEPVLVHWSTEVKNWVATTTQCDTLKEPEELLTDIETILHCPDCGQRTLRLIEQTEPEGGEHGGEYKEIRTCDHCQNMVHLFRNI